MRPVAKKVGAWQSPMKITKRLIASIIMLALSVAFCVWAVFAWFSQNSRVDATGMQVEVEVEDLKLEVELYSLAYVTVKGTQRYEITGELQGNMPQYGSGQCTAILVRMTATNSNATEDRTAALSVTSNGGTTFTQDTDNNGTLLDSFSGALSNAISFSGVSYDGADATNTYALTGTPVSFVGNRGLSSKSTEVFLTDITIPAGQSVVRNYILDYDSDSLSAVYDAILNDSNLNASPSAVVNLQNDLTICLGNMVGGTNISTSADSNTEGACRHTVTLNYNYQVSSEDGTSSDFVETYEVINGETYTPPAPEREGFTFGGWFMDIALSTQYTPRAITVNTTLYAKWDEETVSVTEHIGFRAWDTSIDYSNGETISANTSLSTVSTLINISCNDQLTYHGTFEPENTSDAGSNMPNIPNLNNDGGSTQASAGFKTTNSFGSDSPVFLFTAQASMSLTVYFSLADNNYRGDREGAIQWNVNGSTTQSSNVSNRSTCVSITVTLGIGDVLTVSATNSSTNQARLWFWGYDIAPVSTN